MVQQKGKPISSSKILLIFSEILRPARWVPIARMILITFLKTWILPAQSWVGHEGEKNTLIAKVLAHLDKINFQLDHAKVDVLGDAYEYLIGQFASGAGKKAGEFYTPQQVSTVLARLVTTGKKKLKSAYDPTCGSGSLLLRVAREVKEVGEFYGQELNRTTYNLARMNMILHGVHYQKFNIRQEDTLEKPQHIDKRFEAIVANPPFTAQWSANPALNRTTVLVNMESWHQQAKLISPLCNT